MRDAIEKGKYMADIISGKSRFNGDRNAPVKKVISINREMAASTEDNEDVLDEATVKRKDYLANKFGGRLKTPYN
jgi:hypothetical protein